MMLRLVQFALGRMVLHLCCIVRGGHWDFHWAGVRREIRHLFRNVFGAKRTRHAY